MKPPRSDASPRNMAPAQTDQTGQSGFSLLELLVVVTIASILLGVGAAAYSGCVHNAAMARETAAARTLITAYAAAASDRNGIYLPGYDRTVDRVVLPDNTVVEGPAAERYPFRLAPYFSYKMSGVILVNENARTVDASSTYMVSCYPAFGINSIFVGGDVAASGALPFPQECVTRQAQGAGSILVFATAAAASAQDPSGSIAGGKKVSGYCVLAAPNQRTAMWSPDAWTGKADPADYGHVDARWKGKAICAFLDGGVRMLSIDELRDMRLWSRNALDQNNSGYLIPPASRPGGGRL